MTRDNAGVMISGTGENVLNRLKKQNAIKLLTVCIDGYFCCVDKQKIVKRRGKKINRLLE